MKTSATASAPSDGGDRRDLRVRIAIQPHPETDAHAAEEERERQPSAIAVNGVPATGRYIGDDAA